eukprot:Opistho-1_new@50182
MEIARGIANPFRRQNESRVRLAQPQNLPVRHAHALKPSPLLALVDTPQKRLERTSARAFGNCLKPRGAGIRPQVACHVSEGAKGGQIVLAEFAHFGGHEIARCDEARHEEGAALQDDLHHRRNVSGVLAQELSRLNDRIAAVAADEMLLVWVLAQQVEGKGAPKPRPRLPKRPLGIVGKHDEIARRRRVEIGLVHAGLRGARRRNAARGSGLGSLDQPRDRHRMAVHAHDDLGRLRILGRLLIRQVRVLRRGFAAVWVTVVRRFRRRTRSLRRRPRAAIVVSRCRTASTRALRLPAKACGQVEPIRRQVEIVEASGTDGTHVDCDGRAPLGRNCVDDRQRRRHGATWVGPSHADDQGALAFQQLHLDAVGAVHVHEMARVEQSAAVVPLESRN